MADNPDSVKCAWPSRRGAQTMCGHRARVVVTAAGGRWARAVCGVHLRRAVNAGWYPPGDRCPDDGKCHHDCLNSCFRVWCCGPLSGVYARDEWPQAVEFPHMRFRALLMQTRRRGTWTAWVAQREWRKL